MPGSYVDTIAPGGRPPVEPSEFGGGGGGRPEGRQRRAAMTGILFLFAAIIMVFAAFTSAMVVRRGLGDDWQSLELPPILWANTAVLLASSVLVELARRALKSGRRPAFNGYWTAGTALGLLFLGGQMLAWRQLQSAGVYLATNPSSSFFYLLTVMHALHLAGGIVALLYIDVQALLLRLGPSKRTAVDVSGLYWHFLGGLWLYLILLFKIWG
jgi:cytochrome c oxidase subunit III